MYMRLVRIGAAHISLSYLAGNGELPQLIDSLLEAERAVLLVAGEPSAVSSSVNAHCSRTYLSRISSVWCFSINMRLQPQHEVSPHEVAAPY